MNILVTGNLGYIGTELVDLAKKQGHTIIGLDIGYYSDNLLYDPTSRADIQILADIRDISPEKIPLVDAVIHLAALSNDPICELDPKITFEVNHIAAARLARIAKSKGIARFVFASSASVYGIANSIVSEDSEINPLTAYSKSKHLAEVDLFDLADSDFFVCAMRPATAYGLGARLRTDIVLNNLCAWAHCDRKISIMSDGTPLRPAAHVRDIASAFLAAATCSADLIQKQIFNVGRNEDNYTILQMAEEVGNVLPECDLVFSGEHSDSRSYAINFDKIKDRLGSVANLETNLRQGVEELLLGYSRYGLSSSDFKGGKYTRLSTLKDLISRGQIDHNLRLRVTEGEFDTNVA